MALVRACFGVCETKLASKLKSLFRLSQGFDLLVYHVSLPEKVLPHSPKLLPSQSLPYSSDFFFLIGQFLVIRSETIVKEEKKHLTRS